MKKILYIYLLILFFINCNSKQVYKIKLGDNYYAVGNSTNHLTFEGKIIFEDSNQNQIGYSLYKNGAKLGPSVNYYRNGIVEDSMNYIFNKEHGYSFIYDSTGRLLNKINYFYGQRFGDSYDYALNGEIKHYYFYDFNGLKLYEELKDSTGNIFFTGNLVNASLKMVEEGTQKHIELFLYLIYSPFGDINYYLAKIDKNKIIELKSLHQKDNFFIVKAMPVLDSAKKYAILITNYNYSKKQNDTSIFNFSSKGKIGFSD